MIMTNEKTIEERVKEASAKLKEKGFTFGEVIEIRNAYYDMASEINFDVTSKTIEGETYWKHKNIDGYGFFSKEDAEAVFALHKIAPDVSIKSIMDVYKMTRAMLGLKGGWTFEPKKKGE